MFRLFLCAFFCGLAKAEAAKRAVNVDAAGDFSFVRRHRWRDENVPESSGVETDEPCDEETGGPTPEPTPADGVPTSEPTPAQDPTTEPTSADGVPTSEPTPAGNPTVEPTPSSALPTLEPTPAQDPTTEPTSADGVPSFEPTLEPTPAKGVPSCPVPVVCSCLNDSATLSNHVNWNMCTSDVVKGPDGNLPIRYRNVAPAVDLVITNLTRYVAKNTGHNGRNGCLGELNIAAPGNVAVRFALVKQGTNDVVPAGSAGSTHDMTIFDNDESKAGFTEKVGVSDYSKLEAVYLKPTTTNGVTWLSARQIEVDNPNTNDLNKLTQAQIDASFSVRYTGTNEWVVRFAAEEPQAGSRRRRGGRNFLFSGTSCASSDRHRCHCPVPVPTERPRTPSPTPSPTPSRPITATFYKGTPRYSESWDGVDVQIGNSLETHSGRLTSSSNTLPISGSGLSGLQKVVLKASGSDGYQMSWFSYQYGGDSVCYVPKEIKDSTSGSIRPWPASGLWLDKPCMAGDYGALECYEAVEVTMKVASSCTKP